MCQYCAKSFICILSFDAHNNSLGRHFSSSYYTDEETEIGEIKKLYPYHTARGAPALSDSRERTCNHLRAELAVLVGCEVKCFNVCGRSARAPPRGGGESCCG